MEVTLKAQDIEQLRDIWYGRDTYHDIEEWLEQVNFCIQEICAATSMQTARMMFEQDKIKIEEIGKNVMRELELAKQVNKTHKGDK